MHISKEFLLEAVGLSLVVALILISMQIFQRAVRVTTLLEQNQAEQLIRLEEHEIVKYDGLQMDGMTVVSYIKKMIGTYDLAVQVMTTSAEFTVSEPSQYATLRNPDSENYINPFAKYRCHVERDENAVITKIKIQIEKDEK